MMPRNLTPQQRDFLDGFRVAGHVTHSTPQARTPGTHAPLEQAFESFIDCHQTLAAELVLGQAYHLGNAAGYHAAWGR
jgi:hypothetical protein